MGTAIGFAMTSHPLIIATVFTSLGLGLAAPFVAVALVPAFYRIIPKPGAWMGVMKNFLGFALLLTVLWLVWLFGRVAGPDAVIGLLGFLIALSFGAWLYGQVQYRTFDLIKTLAVITAVAAIGVGGWLGIGDVSTGGPAPQTGGDTEFRSANAEAGDIDWQEWTPTVVDEALQEARPVFVNFTADWCVNCKVNEREVISTSEVVDAAQNADTVMVKADLTHMDDILVEELERFGRSGVPLYLLYDPESPDDPEILPQVLTRSRMIEAFDSVR